MNKSDLDLYHLQKPHTVTNDKEGVNLTCLNKIQSNFFQINDISH